MNKEIKKYKEEVNNSKLLKENHLKLVDTRPRSLLLAILTISLIIFMVALLILIYKGYMKEEIEINPLFNASVDSTTLIENKYDHKIDNDFENYNNNTFIINNFIPDNICDCP